MPLDVAIAVGASGTFGPPPGGIEDGVVGELPAAALDVLVWSEATNAVVTTTEIRAVETTELPVTVTPGARVAVHFGEGLANMPNGLLRVREGGADRFVLAVATKGPFVRGFAPGNYELEFDNLRGKRCSASFSVGGDLAPCEVTLELPE